VNDARCPFRETFAHGHAGLYSEVAIVAALAAIVLPDLAALFAVARDGQCFACFAAQCFTLNSPRTARTIATMRLTHTCRAFRSDPT
jgi:hypothetical protein